jgi:hypothetical protein
MMSRVGGQSFVDADGFSFAVRGALWAGLAAEWVGVAGPPGSWAVSVGLGVPLLQAAVNKTAETGRMKRRTRGPPRQCSKCVGPQWQPITERGQMLPERDDGFDTSVTAAGSTMHDAPPSGRYRSGGGATADAYPAGGCIDRVFFVRR